MTKWLDASEHDQLGLDTQKILTARSNANPLSPEENGNAIHNLFCGSWQIKEVDPDPCALISGLCEKSVGIIWPQFCQDLKFVFGSYGSALFVKAYNMTEEPTILYTPPITKKDCL